MSPEDQAMTVSVVHRQRGGAYDMLDDGTYLPTNHRDVRDILGRLLTHLDAMALPDRAHKAARQLIIREVWAWWDGVYEGATTSYEGCLAPIVASPHGRLADGVTPSNRWGWQSEQAWLDAHRGPEPAAASTPTPVTLVVKGGEANLPAVVMDKLRKAVRDGGGEFA